jgi:hypothetical protein
VASRLPSLVAVSTPHTQTRLFLPLISRQLFDCGRVRAALEDARSAYPLLPPMCLAWLSSAALWILLYSPAIRVYRAGTLPNVDSLRALAFMLAPNTLLSAPRESTATLVATIVYLAIIAAAVASWCWAMRVARTVQLGSCVPLLVLTALITIPLLFAPGLVSDDVYLYDMYGRAISVYGANPVISAPSAFPKDAHLPWVHWKDLPSAYGPIWLMLSASVSALAGNALTTTVVAYRTAGALLHLVIVAVLWRVLVQRSRSALPAVIFYAWNPLVLHEVVANAHNDVLVALFAALLVSAAARSRWSSAAFFGACAVMVKPFAVLLFPAIARDIVRRTRGALRAKQLASAAIVAAVTVTALSLPFWSGVQLVRNAMTNPASHMYTNTIWELMSEAGAAWLGVSTIAVQHPYLDILRGLCFTVGLAWVITRRPARRDVAQVAVRLWLVFCLTACWVWPWYFVPALALAPLAGRRQLAAGTGLTIGGLLFWTAWPERRIAPLDTLYWWRALLLFGPLVVMWALAPARHFALRALGVRRRSRDDDDPLDVGLRTAA